MPEVPEETTIDAAVLGLSTTIEEGKAVPGHPRLEEMTKGIVTHADTMTGAMTTDGMARIAPPEETGDLTILEEATDLHIQSLVVIPSLTRQTGRKKDKQTRKKTTMKLQWPP